MHVWLASAGGPHSKGHPTKPGINTLRFFDEEVAMCSAIKVTDDACSQAEFGPVIS